MKGKWHLLRIFLLLALAAFLFSFSNKRNQKRMLKDTMVIFTNPEQLYVSMGSIHDILTKDIDSMRSTIRTIQIKEMEEGILKHPMVADAEVFLTIDGVLSAKVTQRTPLGRCINKEGIKYLDELGVFMPLSENYSARVPLIYGVEDSLSVAGVMPLLLAIKKDEFMQQSVVTIVHNDEGNVSLQVRQNNLEVLLGKTDELEDKFRRLKGFIKYTKDKNTLEEYKIINLKYENQVVATKK